MFATSRIEGGLTVRYSDVVFRDLQTCAIVSLIGVLILYFHRRLLLPAQIAQDAFLSAILGSSQDHVFSVVEGVAQQIPRAHRLLQFSHRLTTNYVTGTVTSSTEGR